MFLDSAGWVKVPKCFGLTPKQEVYLYLDWYRRMENDEPTPRIKIVPAVIEDSKKGLKLFISPKDSSEKLLGLIPIDSKGRINIKRITPYVYGEWKRDDNYYMYLEENIVYIEKE